MVCNVTEFPFPTRCGTDNLMVATSPAGWDAPGSSEPDAAVLHAEAEVEQLSIRLSCLQSCFPQLNGAGPPPEVGEGDWRVTALPEAWGGVRAAHLAARGQEAAVLRVLCERRDPWLARSSPPVPATKNFHALLRLRRWESRYQTAWLAEVQRTHREGVEACGEWRLSAGATGPTWARLTAFRGNIFRLLNIAAQRAMAAPPDGPPPQELGGGTYLALYTMVYDAMRGVPPGPQLEAWLSGLRAEAVALCARLASEEPPPLSRSMLLRMVGAVLTYPERLRKECVRYTSISMPVDLLRETLRGGPGCVALLALEVSGLEAALAGTLGDARAAGRLRSGLQAAKTYLAKWSPGTAARPH